MTENPDKDGNKANSPTTKLRRRSRTSLADIAYDAISEAIIDRRFGPSEKLNIDSLAEELDMSNTPVREALTRLAIERLAIQDSHHRGYAVAPLLNSDEFYQLFDLRRLLENHALEIAEFDPDAIANLEEIVAQMPFMDTGPVYHDYREYILADSKFHHILVRMSANHFLVQAWEDLHFHLHAGRLYAGTGVIDFRQGLEEHRAIVNALQSGDRDQVLQMANEHIKNARTRLAVLIQTTQE